MPTQKQIADHLDMSQQAAAELVERLGIDHRTASLEAIRIAYIRHLRGQASGHKSEDGLDLIRERVMTERVDRELKQLQVAEKRGMLVNVEQLESELSHMVGAFRAELLARDDKLKTELDTLYAINVDVTLLNEHTYAALGQLSRYDAGGGRFDSPAGASAETTGAHDNDRVVSPVPGVEREGIGQAG